MYQQTDQSTKKQKVTLSIMVIVKVIAAEGEHKASRALRHAAEVITDSPAALQVQGISVALLHYRYRVSRTMRIARSAVIAFMKGSVYHYCQTWVRGHYSSKAYDLL